MSLLTMAFRYGVGFAVEKFRDENDDYQDHLCITFPWMEEKIHPKTKKSASVDKAEEINDIQNALLMAASGASLPVETNQAATSWEGPVSPEVLQEVSLSWHVVDLFFLKTNYLIVLCHLALLI